MNKRIRDATLGFVGVALFVVAWQGVKALEELFGHDAITVGNLDRLSGRRRANVFAQLVLEDLDPDRAHCSKVAPGSYQVKVMGMPGDPKAAGLPMVAQLADAGAPRAPDRGGRISDSRGLA